MKFLGPFLQQTFNCFINTEKTKLKKKPYSKFVPSLSVNMDNDTPSLQYQGTGAPKRRPFQKKPTGFTGSASIAASSYRKPFFKDSSSAFSYRGPRLRVKRKFFFVRARRLHRFRQKIRRIFWRRTRSRTKRGRRALEILLRSVRYRVTRPGHSMLFLSTRFRKLYKFYMRKRNIRARKRALRRRHQNIYTQLRARFPRFFLRFALRATPFGRKLHRTIKLRLVKKFRFFPYAFRRKLLVYGLGIHNLRQYFKYPHPVRFDSRMRRAGTMGRIFKRRAFSQLVKSQTFKARKGLRRRKTSSKYLSLNRYDAHYAYLRTIRRKQRRNFITHPPIGISTRSTRFYKRRYGTLLPFFIRKFRFKKLRRYIRLRRRKRLLVPILPSRRRHRRLYPTLPPAFLTRGFSYVFIKQTTNNVFYSVFSRKKRLLANFSNGRTEFTGSKRMSTVASEAAAKVLVSYFSANRIKSIFFIFGSRFNHFMRAAVKVFRARRIRIAGFKYRMRKPHSLGLRLRSSRRV